MLFKTLPTFFFSFLIKQKYYVKFLLVSLYVTLASPAPIHRSRTGKQSGLKVLNGHETAAMRTTTRTSKRDNGNDNNSQDNHQINTNNVGILPLQ